MGLTYLVDQAIFMAFALPLAFGLDWLRKRKEATKGQ